MPQIQNFLLDRNKPLIKINKDLMFFIDQFVKQKELLKLFNWISSKTKISENALKVDSKIFIFRKFINLEGRFDKCFEIKNLFFDSIKFMMIFFYIRFFSKKIKKKIDCELIVDGITPFAKPERFEKISKLCDTIFVSSIKLNKIYKTFIFNKYKNCVVDKEVCNNYYFFIVLFFKIFFASLKIRTNLFPLVTRLILNYLKYETIFGTIKSKFLIQERFYDTSEIKNEIFHKHGGKLTSVIQKNPLSGLSAALASQVFHMGTYIHSDILFTLGHKSSQSIDEMEGNIKSLIPVGSLFMERDFFNRKESNNFPSFDLLVFTSNHQTKSHSGYNLYYSDYYPQFEWIKQFSNEFPNLKIGLKDKKTWKRIDSKIKKIFKGVKNVEFLLDKSNEWTDSYFLGAKAKALCTSISCLGFEFIGYGKECYYLDPGGRGAGYVSKKNESLSFVRITNYDDFKTKILGSINGKRDEQILKSRENFCLYSDNVSENILKSLRSLEGKTL